MLTSVQRIIINDAKLRAYPYPGVLDRTMSTTLWFDHFIKPATRDLSLRLVAQNNPAVSDAQGVSRNMATIIRGNPWDANHPGRGILLAVRKGEIPANQVFATNWATATHSVEVTEEDPSRNTQAGITMWYDSWPNMTRDLIFRGVCRTTPALRMLLGTNSVPA